jgi:NADPH2:quinone reductase
MLGLVNTPNGKAPVELRELPEPQPARNEALVAVRAFSLNRGELRSFVNNEEGWVPGQDVGGVVLQQAADGSGPAAGSRVVALLDEFGWAERAAVPSHRMAVLPDTVSFSQAATLPVAGLTALRTLRHGAPLLGKRVLITGAAGGVGNIAVQLAARSGARVALHDTYHEAGSAPVLPATSSTSPRKRACFCRRSRCPTDRCRRGLHDSHPQ